MLDFRLVDELRAILDACRNDASARVVALVGRDGLVIDEVAGAADAAEAAPDVDLALAAAEATDLWTVASRLHVDALAAVAPGELASHAGDADVRMRRLASGAFILLVLPAASDAAAARAALDAAAPRLEEALA